MKCSKLTQLLLDYRRGCGRDCRIWWHVFWRSYWCARQFSNSVSFLCWLTPKHGLIQLVLEQGTRWDTISLEGNPPWRLGCESYRCSLVLRQELCCSCWHSCWCDHDRLDPLVEPLPWSELGKDSQTIMIVISCFESVAVAEKRTHNRMMFVIKSHCDLNAVFTVALVPASLACDTAALYDSPTLAVWLDCTQLHQSSRRARQKTKPTHPRPGAAAVI